MPSDRRRVNFTDSPTGGFSSRYTSDSGVGSLSDQASRAANPNPFAAQPVEGQWTNLGQLQEAYRSVFASKEHYKKKAKDLDEDAQQSRKLAKEVEAKWRAIVDRNEQLEEEKEKIFKEKKHLADQVKVLRQQLDEANDHIQQLQRNSPPVMSGANPEPKPHRSTSKRESAKEEKKRLSRRFEPKDGDTKSESTSSSKPPRTRRQSQSYVEPFGPGPSRQVPPSPINTTRPAQYSTYTQSTHHEPVISTTREPTYSSTPRSVHPEVYLTNDDFYDEPTYQEDGQYHPYPLPPEPSTRHHRSRHSRGA